MKEIHVLGLGPGIENYTNPNETVTIGVNDIWKYYKTDYVLCMDKIDAFNQERFDVILNCNPLRFFTLWRSWSYIRKATLINIDNTLPGRGGLVDNLDNWDKLPFHVDSTFTAVCIAYHLGLGYHDFQSIVMFGCRFYGHPQLENFLPAIRESYTRLRDALAKKRITLYNADKESLLNTILPFYEPKIK